jgi:hypothetical protein
VFAIINWRLLSERAVAGQSPFRTGRKKPSTQEVGE